MAFNTLPNTSAGDIRSPSPALSPTSTLVDGSPREARTPVRHRPTFARLASVFDGSQQKYDAVKGDDEIPNPESGRISGLGISYGPGALHARSFSGSMATNNIDTSYDPGSGKSARYDTGSLYWSSTSRGKQSTTSFASTIQHNFSPQSDTQLLHGKPSFTETLKSHYDDFTPSSACPSRRQFHHQCSSWPSMIIFILSIYSTVFSGIYLVLAARGPRYGKYVSNRKDGLLTSANANLLTAFFAKTIEISFATVFVAFLGQVLWRRAFLKSRGRGVTLAEMDMRSWVMQPGTMLTRFGAMRSTVVSSLGILTFAAAFMALLYTTASEALVQPQLRSGNWEPRSMQGMVKASWANSNYLSQICSSPMKSGDTEYGGTTCLQIEYAAQAYHNYQRYLSNWDTPVKYGNGSTELRNRPQGFALVTENTTVSGQWIEIKNGGNVVDGRVINNVSMAMPHFGVTSAARDSRNGIMQPEDLDGLGIYSLQASVPSSAVNVLCANMNADELKDIVYDSFASKHDGAYSAPDWISQSGSVGPEFINNKTVVDDLFGWGKKYNQAPPLFAKLPLEYNTVLNHTGPYGRLAIYLLGKPPAATTADYFLCAIKAYQIPSCSTRYNVSRSVATLEALCEDETDEMQYINSLPNATQSAISTDWVEGATDWANSLSLNAGTADENASNARLLTQFGLAAPTDSTVTDVLSPVHPSPAEALAVMAGCTLLMGTQDTPFVEFYNYTPTILEAEQYQWFNATTQTQEYASGGSKGYQHGFFLVLALVFLLNAVCLIYLSIHRGMITDFSEPVNLFSLAVNSPPSHVMAGSCGGGPQGKQYRAQWYVNAAGDHLYIENAASGGEEEGHEMHTTRGEHGNQPSSIRRAFDRLSKQANLI